MGVLSFVGCDGGLQMKTSGMTLKGRKVGLIWKSMKQTLLLT